MHAYGISLVGNPGTQAKTIIKKIPISDYWRGIII